MLKDPSNSRTEPCYFLKYHNFMISIFFKQLLSGIIAMENVNISFVGVLYLILNSFLKNDNR